MSRLIFLLAVSGALALAACSNSTDLTGPPEAPALQPQLLDGQEPASNNGATLLLPQGQEPASNNGATPVIIRGQEPASNN